MNNDNVELLPQINSQATITIKPYMTALTFNNEGDVYMLMIKEDYIDKLVLQENHTIHFNNRILKLYTSYFVVCVD